MVKAELAFAMGVNCEPEAVEAPVAQASVAPASSASDERRLERAARENFQFIWRSLRRLGVQPDHAVDDAVQRVFEIAAARASLIIEGHERGFLFKTALFVAKERRRSQRSAREVLDLERLASEVDPHANPEQLLAERRFRDVLDVLLESLPAELRSVFVLYELEGLAMHEIASLLELPAGTVASRLRRARHTFEKQAQRLRAQLKRREVTR